MGLPSVTARLRSHVPMKEVKPGLGPLSQSEQAPQTHRHHPPGRPSTLEHRQLRSFLDAASRKLRRVGDSPTQRRGNSDSVGVSPTRRSFPDPASRKLRHCRCSSIDERPSGKWPWCYPNRLSQPGASHANWAQNRLQLFSTDMTSQVCAVTSDITSAQNLP